MQILISRYNLIRGQYNEVSEELISIKDKITDLELKRLEFRKSLISIRDEESEFLENLKSENPEDYNYIMNRIKMCAFEEVDK